MFNIFAYSSTNWYKKAKLIDRVLTSIGTVSPFLHPSPHQLLQRGVLHTICIVSAVLSSQAEKNQEKRLGPG